MLRLSNATNRETCVKNEVLHIKMRAMDLKINNCKNTNTSVVIYADINMNE